MITKYTAHECIVTRITTCDGIVVEEDIADCNHPVDAYLIANAMNATQSARDEVQS